MRYENDYTENRPETYVTYYNLDQACALLYHASRAHDSLTILDTPVGMMSTNLKPPHKERRDFLMELWKAATYDIGYRNAPIPQKRIIVDLSNIHEHISAQVMETEKLPFRSFVDESGLPDRGHIMEAVEILYNKGLEDGLEDLENKQYAWEL